jgi:hypothetical protein
MQTYRNEGYDDEPQWSVIFRGGDGCFQSIKTFSDEKDAVALVNHLNGGGLALALSDQGWEEFKKSCDE